MWQWWRCALKFVCLSATVMFSKPIRRLLLEGVSLRNIKKTKHTRRNPTTQNQLRMNLHVNGAHIGQNHLLVAGREGDEWSEWETLTNIMGGGALGRWQNSPVQTAASTNVIQSKETEWENNSIKLMFDLFNLQCCFWLYRSVTCWSWSGGGDKSVLSERRLEESWQRPMKTTHYICLVAFGICVILFNFQRFTVSWFRSTKMSRITPSLGPICRFKTLTSIKTWSM